MTAPVERRNVLEFYLETLRRTGSDLREFDSPATLRLVQVICGVFLLQAFAAVALETTTHGVLSTLFLQYPVAAWLLSFFLHGDSLHFLVNAVELLYLGRIAERYFTRKPYLLFWAATAALTAAGAYAATAPFTAAPVAAYGASGFVFALAGYSLHYPFRPARRQVDRTDQADWAELGLVRSIELRTDASERLAFLVGVSALLTVAIDVATGPYFTVQWLNGAHLSGLLVGLLAGYVRPSTRPRWSGQARLTSRDSRRQKGG